MLVDIDLKDIWVDGNLKLWGEAGLEDTILLASLSVLDVITDELDDIAVSTVFALVCTLLLLVLVEK